MTHLFLLIPLHRVMIIVTMNPLDQFACPPLVSYLPGLSEPPLINSGKGDGPPASQMHHQQQQPGPKQENHPAPNSSAYQQQQQQSVGGTGMYGAPAPNNPGMGGGGGYGNPNPTTTYGGGGAAGGGGAPMGGGGYGAGASGGYGAPPSAGGGGYGQGAGQNITGGRGGGYGAGASGSAPRAFAPNYGSGSGPVARNSAPPNIVPIAALSPYTSRWTIKARVSSKSDLRRFNSQRGEGKLFSFDLLDKEGGEIRVTGFGGEVDKYFDVVQVGSVYLISKAGLQPKKPVSEVVAVVDAVFAGDAADVMCHTHASV